MGVYGVDAENNVVIPTVWTELGVVQGAATPSGDASTDSSLPVWAQVQGMIGDLDALNSEVKSKDFQGVYDRENSQMSITLRIKILRN